MVDARVRACLQCRVYVLVNAASVKNQRATDQFEKDHKLHMIETVGLSEITKDYTSITRQYIDTS
nr:hypothetical protein [Candidatus Sigynarchaeota archaeon]